jgi:RNA polymerase sigma-70 factor (ECF subfamily)
VEAKVTDAELIRASLEDPGAFTGLFERHFATIHGYLQRQFGSDLADELAGETFVEAFAGRSRYDLEPASALPWLFGIAVNLSRHHHRTERRRAAAYARADSADSADEWAIVDRRLDAAAMGPNLAQSLSALAEGDRDALLLFAWADLSYDQVAQVLAIPTGTVKSRISRARGRLRELLAASGQVLDEEKARNRNG